MLTKVFNKREQDSLAQDSADLRPYRGRVIIAALACVALTAAQHAIGTRRGGDKWSMGDWLINYQGGFIRRGLIGQLLFSLTPDGPTLLWSTFVLQVLLAVGVAGLTLRLFFGAPRSPAWLIVLFSPAFVLLFPLIGPGGAFRKELLLAFSFLLLLNGLLPQPRHALLVSALVAYAVAVFSHELAAMTLPFFLFMLYELYRRDAADDRARGAAIGYALAFSVLAGSGVLLVLLVPGSARASAAVCASLLERDLTPELCKGAIRWLRHDSSYGFSQVVNRLPRYIQLLPSLLIAQLPIVLTGFYRTHGRLMALGLLALVPLFIFGADWGRWIHIYISLLFFVLLYESCRMPLRMPDLRWYFIAPYICLWGLPHVAAWHFSLNLVGRLAQVLSKH